MAAVFHWPLSEMAAMELDELSDWHARAIDCFKRINKRE
ncbi:GpE family phage tail protein [Motilimonas sp. 1_MG-2023]|nr:GpE family phage tail protein [Motilimonas sp. 1_MG-2023]MDO6525429.1 GpE family phage tail protein [Motilimonas sp. 1_MG-2023]